MLNSPDLDGRTYEELIEENIARIPLYSQEWTNYNPSDPGITVLENLTAFQALQRSGISQVSGAVKRNLLKIAGFVPEEGKAARVYVRGGQGGEAPAVLLKGQKLRAGRLCFETLKETAAGQGEIKGIVLKQGGVYEDVTERLCGRELPSGVRVFDGRPETSLYLIVDKLPGHGRKFAFFADMIEKYPCNPPEHGKGFYVPLRFLLLTAQGYREMEARDDTGGFLADGMIELRMPAAVPKRVRFQGREGCLIKCVPEGEYSVPPVLKGIYGNMFPVAQQDTKCVRLTFAGADSVEVRNALAEEGGISVYCQEEKNGSYRAYEPWGETERRGRFYRLERRGRGIFRIVFDKNAFGFAPASGEKEGVTVVLCGEELTGRRKLSEVCGYDEQEMELGSYGGVVPSAFSVMTRIRRPGEEDTYAFFRPGERGEGALCYRLLQNGDTASICIEDPGEYEGAMLYISGLSIHEGAAGNLRPGNVFYADCGEARAEFYNPGVGGGGKNAETAEDCAERFAASVHRPYSLVTEEDYERAVRSIPGLGVHKVRAFRREDGGVGVAVQTFGEERLPTLTQSCLSVIRREIGRRRLMTVRAEVCQPEYVQIHVRASLRMKSGFDRGRERAGELIREKLDYVGTDRGFGETVSFQELYRALKELECVEEVYELSLWPGEDTLAVKSGMDIRLKQNCLCYAGRIELELTETTDGQ